MVPRIRERFEAAGFNASDVVPDARDGAPMLLIEAERTGDAKFDFDLAVSVTWRDAQILLLYVARIGEGQMDACADAQVPQLAKINTQGAIDWETRSQNSRTPIGLRPLELHV
jgi:hypothetical protein